MKKVHPKQRIQLFLERRIERHLQLVQVRDGFTRIFENNCNYQLLWSSSQRWDTNGSCLKDAVVDSITDALNLNGAYLMKYSINMRNCKFQFCYLHLWQPIYYYNNLKATIQILNSLKVVMVLVCVNKLCHVDIRC